MPTIASTDGTKLYYEEAGSGTPIVFVHEFAGDYRTWEAQLRHFARMHRCVTYSARGYPPSDVPTDPARYGQDIVRGDVIAVMDALGIEKAHVVGHSMGGYTALHVGARGGLRLGLGGRSGRARRDAQAGGREREIVFGKNHGGSGGDLRR